jgi:hypothetical protein
MKKILYGVFMMVVLAFFSGMPAYAQDGTDSAWKVSVTPFFWLIGLSGTANVKGHSADVDMNMSDVLDNLDAAATLNVEAGNDRYGVFVQPVYLKLSVDATGTLPISGAEVESELTMTTTIIEFGGFSRLVDVKRATGGHNTIDLVGGLRYWDMCNEVKLKVPSAELSRKAEKDGNLLDPFVGLRMKAFIADKVPYSLRADIGGLNTGSSSNFTYNLLALVGYDVAQNITVFGGYRVLYLDYGNSEEGFDLMSYGPLVGAQFTF